MARKRFTITEMRRKWFKSRPMTIEVEDSGIVRGQSIELKLEFAFHHIKEWNIDRGGNLRGKWSE